MKQNVSSKKNKDLKYIDDIDLRITEAETRIELALHYKIPYPRLHNVIRTTPERVRKSKISTFNDPVYMASYYHDNELDSEPVSTPREQTWEDLQEEIKDEIKDTKEDDRRRPAFDWKNLKNLRNKNEE